MAFRNSAVKRMRGAVGMTVLALVALSAHPAIRLTAQVDRLATRFAAMTAVTGYEQAMADSLLTLLPGSVRDRTGNVTLTFGRGAPKRLVACPLDEAGYVVGNVTDDGYLTLRRVAGRAVPPLFDQQLEGHRVTVFGTKGAVPGVVAVKSTHLTRGRPGGADPIFSVDNAYVDVGAASRDDAQALGVGILSPVALAKRPQEYGDHLLAAPAAGRRAACAVLAAAAQANPKVRGTVVVAFTVQSLYRLDTGLASVVRLQGPFDQVTLLDGRPGTPGSLLAAGDTMSLPTRYTDTAVETVSLADARALAGRLAAWMEGER